MRRAFGVAAAAVVLLTGATATSAQTVYLVRHAEKADASADPELSEAGQARAAALAEALAGAGIDHVLVTPLRRTNQTAGPLAERLGLTATPIAFGSSSEAHVEAVAAAVRALPDDAVVLVVGHSNTVPAIARALGDPAERVLTDCDYDTLTVLTLDDEAAARAVHARYGAPTEACPA